MLTRSVPPGLEEGLYVRSMASTTGGVLRDELAGEFAAEYQQDPGRGYGAGAHELLAAVGTGMPWRQATRISFPDGSYGNGATMRVAPLGAYFADDLDRVPVEATSSAQITHAHHAPVVDQTRPCTAQEMPGSAFTSIPNCRGDQSSIAEPRQRWGAPEPFA